MNMRSRVLLTSGTAQTMAALIPFIIGRAARTGRRSPRPRHWFVVPILCFNDSAAQQPACAASPSGRCANEWTRSARSTVSRAQGKRRIFRRGPWRRPRPCYHGGILMLVQPFALGSNTYSYSSGHFGWQRWRASSRVTPGVGRGRDRPAGLRSVQAISWPCANQLYHTRRGNSSCCSAPRAAARPPPWRMIAVLSSDRG